MQRLQYIKRIIVHLAGLMAIYSLLRLVFYLLNAHLLGAATGSMFLGGLRFDLSALIYLNLPYLLLSTIPLGFRSRSGYQFSLRLLFIITNAIGIFFAIVDFQYFKFVGKRSTADLFQFMGTGDDVLKLIPSFIADYWYLLLFFILLVWLLNKLFDLPPALYREPIFKPVHFAFDLVLFVVAFGLMVIAARGGLQLRPLSIPDATRYARGQGAAIVLNTPFTMLKSLGDAQLKPINRFSKKEMDKAYPVIHQYEKDSVKAGPNVVILILESFSKQHVGFYHPGEKSITPHLDSILASSLSFRHSYANGKKSMEAMPSILASIPAWMQGPLITSPYANNRIVGLAEHLGDMGYSSTFFHGGNVGTMGFDAFANQIGFDRYAGLGHYPYPERDYDGTWGIFDEPFLQWTLGEMDDMKRPFLSVIFTLSSHHPYAIPEKHKGQFSDIKGPMRRSIAYSDLALGQFFRKAAKKDWFDKTLFVITADHTPASNSYYYNNTPGIWDVPIAFYQPGVIAPSISDTIAQHIDIMPAVLDFTGFNEPFFSFGQAPWRKTNPFGMNYVGSIYWYWNNSHVLKHNGKKPIGLYQYRKDRLLTHNLLGGHDSIAHRMSRSMMMRIQRYHHAMLQNKLTAP